MVKGKRAGLKELGAAFTQSFRAIVCEVNNMEDSSVIVWNANIATTLLIGWKEIR
jgi:hypothetical protein